MKQLIFLRNYILYIIAKIRNYINVVSGIAFVVATIYWVIKTNTKNFDYSNIESWWNAWGDPFIGLSTFLVAIVIWLTNLAKDWEDRLDKKLTVSYQLISDNNREVIRCENAFLAHEGDIRNWGQSLGRQTIGKNDKHYLVNFDFSNTMKVERPEVIHENKQFYKLYSATLFLTTLPKDKLENGKNMKNGKFVWKEGENQSEFILIEPSIPV